MGNELTKELYSPREVADLTGTHLNTVYRWVRTGYLPAIVQGPRRIFVTKDTLHALLIGKDYSLRASERTNNGTI